MASPFIWKQNTQLKSVISEAIVNALGMEHRFCSMPLLESEPEKQDKVGIKIDPLLPTEKATASMTSSFLKKFFNTEFQKCMGGLFPKDLFWDDS